MMAFFHIVAGLLNAGIMLLKWPLALALAALLPGCAVALWQALARLLHAGLRLWPFWTGFAVFFLLVRLFWRRSAILLWIWTLEHEATHALFALATGHPVVGFSVGPDKGSVKYLGLDTWLIRISPYFFPLYLLAALGILGFTGRLASTGGQLALGAAFASTVLHMFHEFHPRQADLDVAGRPFSWFFVPAANVATWGLFLFFFLHGRPGIGTWWSISWQNARTIWHTVAIALR